MALSGPNGITKHHFLRIVDAIVDKSHLKFGGELFLRAVCEMNSFPLFFPLSSK